jgi:hypothetical protein
MTFTGAGLRLAAPVRRGDGHALGADRLVTHRFELDEVPRADDLFDDTVGSGPLEVAFLRK